MNLGRILTLGELLAVIAIGLGLYWLWTKLTGGASLLAAANDYVNAWIGTGSAPGFVQTGTAADGTPTGIIEIHQDPVDTAEIIGNQAHDGLDPFGATGGFYT